MPQIHHSPCLQRSKSALERQKIFCHGGFPHGERENCIPPWNRSPRARSTIQQPGRSTHTNGCDPQSFKLPLSPPHQSIGPCTVLLLCMAQQPPSLSFSWEQRTEFLLESTLGTSLVVKNLPSNAEDAWSGKIPLVMRQLSLCLATTESSCHN